jgi:hypothetical protein
MPPGGDYFFLLYLRTIISKLCIYYSYDHVIISRGTVVVQPEQRRSTGRKVHQYPDAPPPQVKTGPAGAGFFAEVKVTYI